MPHLRSKSPVEAVVAGDWHLSLNAPVARREKWQDWTKVMESSFKRLNEIVKQHKAKYVISTGDIFHIWNSPVELVNFAIHMFRDVLKVPVYSIAGNHDLPNHDIEQIKRSAYWTLVQAGVIRNIGRRCPVAESGEETYLWGFSCSEKLLKRGRVIHGGKNVAVIHDYCHKMGHDFPGAPEEKRAIYHRKTLGDGYDAAFFGDNHKGFLDATAQLTNYMPLLNVGGFIRRNIDEADYEPQVGLLHEDGNVSVQKLGVPAQWEVDYKEKAVLGSRVHALDEVVNLIQDIKSGSLDYRDAVEQYVRRKDVHPIIARILIHSME